jgi:hypothetical protein
MCDLILFDPSMTIYDSHQYIPNYLACSAPKPLAVWIIVRSKWRAEYGFDINQSIDPTEKIQYRLQADNQSSPSPSRRPQKARLSNLCAPAGPRASRPASSFIQESERSIDSIIGKHGWMRCAGLGIASAACHANQRRKPS